MNKYGIPCPCNGCPKHAATCHSGCKDYADYRSKIDQINAQKRKERFSDSYVIERIAKIKAKQAKRNKGRRACKIA